MKKASKASKKSVSKAPKKAVKKAASKAPAKKRVAAPVKKASKAAKKAVKKVATKKATVSKTRNESPSFEESLNKVMTDALKDIYYAEKQLVKALNKMMKAAENEELKGAFETHMQETEGQVEKLEQAFEVLGMRAAGKKCPAMDGLVEEGKEAIEEFDKGPARDAALIMSAQKAEHYEISSYGTLRTFAQTLGYDECALIFDSILEQESNTDEILTKIAASINKQAAGSKNAGSNGTTANAEDGNEEEESDMETADMEEDEA